MNVLIVGGGMAGSEAAWQLAQRGIPVTLKEMRPLTRTAAHQGDCLAELVCSNSFRSDDWQTNAVGVLHQEMRMLDSLMMNIAKTTQVPAGSALAVDRELFSTGVTQAIKAHPLINIERDETTKLPPVHQGPCLIATGPLTSKALSEEIQAEIGEEHLAFFDAIAPVVYRNSIDFSKAWYQSRYDKQGPGGNGKDYINLPLNKQQYNDLIEDLLHAEKVSFHEWEKKTNYFEACLPIEIMAKRGPDTLRFGPLKPVGLTNPHQADVKPFAVVQLRQDNKLATLYNLVGFQTKMKQSAQPGVFRKIPGLEHAEFARLGGIHRNTFIRSPAVLDQQLRMKSKPWLRFAGQITGVEGYVESGATGILAALMILHELKGKTWLAPPQTTAHGALLAHIIGQAELDTFQPMNINFGLMPPPNQPETTTGRTKNLKGRERKAFMAARALCDFEIWTKTCLQKLLS